MKFFPCGYVLIILKPLYIYNGSERGFSLLEWEVTEEQAEEMEDPCGNE